MSLRRLCHSRYQPVALRLSVRRPYLKRQVASVLCQCVGRCGKDDAWGYEQSRLRLCACGSASSQGFGATTPYKRMDKERRHHRHTRKESPLVELQKGHLASREEPACRRLSSTLPVRPLKAHSPALPWLLLLLAQGKFLRVATIHAASTRSPRRG